VRGFAASITGRAYLALQAIGENRKIVGEGGIRDK